MKTFGFFLIICLFLLQNTFSQTNDNCADAISLPLRTTCTISIFSNEGAGAESETVAPEPSCGLYKGGDVWFTAVVPATGAVRIETTNLKGATSHSIAVYSGTCGEFTEVECMRQDKERTIYNPSLAGETIYIRVFSLNGAAGSSFELCVYEPSIPENNLCENALWLDVESLCGPDTFSNKFATADPISIAPDPSCDAYRGGDIWFKTIMPASGQLRVNKNRISGATHPAMSIYSGVCGDFDEQFCSLNDPTETFSNSALAGETIYLRFYSYYAEEGAIFSVCLYEDGAPGNDGCEDAITLPTGASCVMSDFSNLHATVQPSVAPEPTCGNYKGADVWFKFTVPTSGNLRVETDVETGPAARSLTLYSGSCGSFTEVACMSNDKGETFLFPSLAGKSLYLRAFTINSDDGGPFSLCVFEPALPSNDRCEDAISLSVNETCNFETFTNAFASEEAVNIAPDPSCGEYQGGDVWFMAKVPASGQLRIGTDTFQSSVNKSITIYSGTCGNFYEVVCGQLKPYLVIDEPALAGETVYIRLFSYANDEGGEFDLCLQEYTCETDTTDVGEVSICQGASYSFGSQTITEPGEYSEVFQSLEGCDSVVTFMLIVEDVDTSVSVSGSMLTATAMGASYQWLDCLNGNLPIAGATQQSFIVAEGGEYAVAVAEKSCVDTSACYAIQVLGLKAGENPGFKLFPNPVQTTLNISFPASPGFECMELLDIKGQTYKKIFDRGKQPITLDLSALTQGVYIIKIQTTEGVFFEKVIKE